MNTPPNLPLLNNYIEHWAKVQPNQLAMLQYEDDKQYSYRQFLRLIDMFALRLLRLGLKPGDRLATQLVLVPEHVMIMYACFKIGVIFAPMDLRLKADEVVRDINKIEPKAFLFLGKTPVNDFRKVGRAVQSRCPAVEHLIQFSADPEDDIIDGAIGISALMKKSTIAALVLGNVFTRQLEKAYKKITPDTAALIIYTTGTTGEPKPAMLSHENILTQNQVLTEGIGTLGDGGTDSLTTLVNLPPSHVGCVTETLMTTFFRGGKTILLKIFGIESTLDAIQKHRVTLLGQIPTQYRMLWNHPNYAQYDLSSLEYVIYAGSAADLPFLQRLSTMAPHFGTGLGMTESAGFATFSPRGLSPETLLGQVGRSFPALANVTIRKPIENDGSAGDECELGEPGEICYHPPIAFLGYYNDPQGTKKALSSEGILYTGDMGYFKAVEGEQALFLSGREKFAIKQKGYKVFPGEVEDHIARLPGVEQAEVVGVKHRLFDEGIFAFVKLEAASTVSVADIANHCKEIASYKRPQHIELWPYDKDFPLNRSTKVDKLVLQNQANSVVEELRRQKLWDE